jgi:hypothetical protein
MKLKHKVLTIIIAFLTSFTIANMITSANAADNIKTKEETHLLTI